MYPKLKIESGIVSISGECTEKIPYEYGVKWKEKDGYDTGNIYKFKLDVNGDKGIITFSDELLNTLNNKDFQHLFVSDLTFSTSLAEFRLILYEAYKNWLEMSKISPL